MGISKGKWIYERISLESREEEKMRYLLLALLMSMSVPVMAGPYFRFEPFSETKQGAFFGPLDSAEDIKLGTIMPIIRHHAEDGHLIFSGIDWDLLNVGWQFPTDNIRGTAVLGPSINLEEPIKSLLRKGVDRLPGAKKKGSYGALRYLFKPGTPEEEKMFLALGPSFGLETADKLSKWKGRFLISLTLNKRFR